MLNDRHARLLRYDPATDEARIEVSDAGSGPALGAGKTRTIEGQLLLDAQGYLVGVDLGGEGLARAVVMLGPHEKVEETKPVTIVVHADASGGAAELVTAGAKAALRGGEKNPYV